MSLLFDPISQPNCDIICVLSGNKVHGRIRHPYVILWWTYCFPSYKKNVPGEFHSDLLASFSWWCTQQPLPKWCLSLFWPVQLFLSRIICAYHWVIPTTALHIHGQTTEWRYIHVCSGSSISILTVWELHCCSIQSAQLWLGVFFLI